MSSDHMMLARQRRKQIILVLVWAGSIVTRARKENRIANDYMMLALIEQIDKFRGLAGGLINHDWVTIPLVYTQVVTLAVYTFLLSTLMGRQFLNPVILINI